LVASQQGLSKSAAAFVANQLQLTSDKVKYHSGYTAEHGVSYAYLKQAHEDIPFANSVSNVVIKGDKVTAFGHSFVDTCEFIPPL
jgi:extracellular elastinolytic metalloproteinase